MTTPPPIVSTRTTELGTLILETIKRHTPSVFSKNFYLSRMIQLTLRHPGLKQALFTTIANLELAASVTEQNAVIAKHLAPALGEIAKPLGWFASGGAYSPHGIITRLGLLTGISLMGSMFIAGSSVQAARRQLERVIAKRANITIDLLGEYARTTDQAQAYVTRYVDTITHVAQHRSSLTISPSDRISVSVKLSALCPYELLTDAASASTQMLPRLMQIAQCAAANNVTLCIDAEDSVTNAAVYSTFEALLESPIGAQLVEPGIVVQSHFKDAHQRLKQLYELAVRYQRRISIRLVKGAYWDSEIARARARGIPSPVWDTKNQTDRSFEELASWVLDRTPFLFPMFGSHNVRSLAHVLAYAEHKRISPKEFELQTLFGMAEPLQGALADLGHTVRVYIPLGERAVGMGYLVRRLQENSSNESFIKSLFLDRASPEALLMAP